MKIRSKFFFIFISIAILSSLVTYYISSLSIKKLLKENTQQSLDSSIYINYFILKETISKLYESTDREIKAKNLNGALRTRNSIDINLAALNLFDYLELDYLYIQVEKPFVFSKSKYPNIKVDFTKLNNTNFIITPKGLLVLAKVQIEDKKFAFAGKFIDQDFMKKKLYDDNSNLILYWNGKVFLSSTSVFSKFIPVSYYDFKLDIDIKDAKVFSTNWENKSYKLKFYPVLISPNNSLILASMTSNILEEEAFSDATNNLILFLVFFILNLMALSLYLSNNLTTPFYDLAKGISKKDKNQIKNLLIRKDEIGTIANDFWKITDDLIKEQEQKEKLTSLIAHDLKTPLVAITRTLEIIRDKESLGKEQRVFFVNMMIKHCNQSLDLINNLLKVQKYELGKSNLFMQQENINTLVEEVVTGLTPISDAKGIILTFSTDNRITPILFDRNEIQRVINNLVSNAIKYTEEGGMVKVSTNLNEDYLEVVIVDNGHGIPFEEHSKMFSFYKISHNNPEEKEGPDVSTGLGLYLCKQIVEAHGGKIGFESHKNRGSTFYFSLPIK